MEKHQIADDSAHELPPEEVIFGTTARMQEIRRRLERLACTNIPLLITGPSGTGKEMLSRLLHLHSPWRDNPFVKVDCPSTPETLLEIEHFGRALCGDGRSAAVQYGTLFLDEIGELRPALQSKLLHLLQDGSFCRIRERDPQRTGRIVCTTRHDLRAEVRAGLFRSDLYYRINVLNIQLPPLTERRDDVPVLVEHFLDRFRRAYGRNIPPLSSSMMRKLSQHSWPGNIRELQNLLRQYVLFGSEDVLEPALIPNCIHDPELSPGEEHVSLKALTREAARRLEREVMVQTLKANSWNRKKTARKLGISYRSLLYKLKDAGISRTKRSPSSLTPEMENADALD